ncbi:hypothetical protein R0135_06130 [Congregibacter variabilis]|uniref:DUF2474 domain-containing protein n=1 Tax=Congregibacter variabilis TaxID=3081200 RepID=A0ABZ0I8F1_9GAMM|nr:hypothetical protein R0135_06130 [Congregibacter sp. IMCC43200]
MSEDKPRSSKINSRGLQWVWFIGLWIAGVLSVGSVSMLLRSILLP